jgi:hypothetical protein
MIAGPDHAGDLMSYFEHDIHCVAQTKIVVPAGLRAESLQPHVLGNS